jgi:hypothetical protein
MGRRGVVELGKALLPQKCGMLKSRVGIIFEQL